MQTNLVKTIIDLYFSGIVICNGITDTISDDDKCRMLQEAGLAALPVWAEYREVPISLFVNIELLESNGWDLNDQSNIEEHFCRIAGGLSIKLKKIDKKSTNLICPLKRSFIECYF